MVCLTAALVLELKLLRHQTVGSGQVIIIKYVLEAVEEVPVDQFVVCSEVDHHGVGRRVRLTVRVHEGILTINKHFVRRSFVRRPHD